MLQFFKPRFLLLLVVWLLAATAASAQGRPLWLADLLANRPALTDPAERAEVAREMRLIQEERKALATERARREGLPLRTETAEGAVAELMDFDGDTPLYAITYNQEAAITTAASATRTDFGVSGDGFTVGIWDAGSLRLTHEAFTRRAATRDGSAYDNHATHVAGTMAAAGPNSRARGMASGAFIDSYDWNSDKAEMTARGASYAREPGTLVLSNHSYGYRSGWDGSEWFGNGVDQSGVEENFGRYNNYARDMDSLAYSLPYYLAFWAAGNDRSNNPAEGSTVTIGGNIFTYDSAVHPRGDGVYKQGHDTIGFESLAKNVMTVGGVNDAVTSGRRDLAKATMTGFSSWGPTDDGRIKPDIVANGSGVYSTTSGGDTSYGNMSGTSMATPNASGSAQLLASHYSQLFPNNAMRASTLKGLIIHTADDLGTPGPDYSFGWGLMNTHAAAAHLSGHHANPGSRRLVEAQLSSTALTHTYTFDWDGISPIRATLAWTDPAGSATNTHDNRTRRLVNNLDVMITGPEGELHQPYVMPYVASWSQRMLAAPATTGKNDVDNVEQVLVESPVPGTYTATVTVDGPLANNQQFYSLIISGSAGIAAPAPTIASESSSISGDIAVFDVLGNDFQQGAQVSLMRQDQEPRHAFSHETTPNRLKARVNVADLAVGSWSVVVTNVDGQQAVLGGDYTVTTPLWAENFDGEVQGWTTTALAGSTHWGLSETSSRSPSRSFFAPGPAARNADVLESPPVAIPAEAEALSLSFWHFFNLQNERDGGVLEFSINGGPWLDVTDPGTGASFVTGGYGSSPLSGIGSRSNRNPLEGRHAWSGNQSGFSEVVVSLDPSIYAGQSMRMRWILGTDNSIASSGWYIDDVAILGAGPARLPVPEIVQPASASQDVVTTASVDLTVEARNSDGSADLTYTWTVNDSREAPVTFTENSSADAHMTTALFSAVGDYRFEVNVRNGSGESITSAVDVTVVQSETVLVVSPAVVAVPASGQQQFEAVVLDQFDAEITPQPNVQWGVEPAAGTISSSGVFTAAENEGGPFSLLAETAAGTTGAASVTVEAPIVPTWHDVYFTASEREDEAISGDGADPDGDGIVNLMEYALGTHPRESSRVNLPTLSLEGSGPEPLLTFSFSRPSDYSGVEYRVEISPDLLAWDVVAPETWQVETVGDKETVVVRQPVSAGFLRLRVLRP